MSTDVSNQTNEPISEQMPASVLLFALAIAIIVVGLVVSSILSAV
jgi:hypothetical protein